MNTEILLSGSEHNSTEGPIYKSDIKSDNNFSESRHASESDDDDCPKYTYTSESECDEKVAAEHVTPKIIRKKRTGPKIVASKKESHESKYTYKKIIPKKLQTSMINKSKELHIQKSGDMKNIIIERIDSKYSKGKYWGYVVTVMNDNGYINASKLCNDVCEKGMKPKVFEDWKKNKQLKNIVDIFSIENKIPKYQLFINIKGNKMTTGTYIHRDLVPHFVSWASPILGLTIGECDTAIIIQSIEEKNDMICEKDETIKELEKKIRLLSKESRRHTITMNILHEMKLILDEHVKRHVNDNSENDSTDKSDSESIEYDSELIEPMAYSSSIKSKSNCVSKGKQINKSRKNRKEILVLFRNNKDIDFDYTIIQIFADDLDIVFDNHQGEYPDCKIILNITVYPSSIWEKVLDELSASGQIVLSGNDFFLSDTLSERRFIKMMKASIK